jgi:hypothetical protein
MDRNFKRPASVGVRSRADAGDLCFYHTRYNSTGGLFASDEIFGPAAGMNGRINQLCAGIGFAVRHLSTAFLHPGRKTVKLHKPISFWQNTASLESFWGLAWPAKSRSPPARSGPYLKTAGELCQEVMCHRIFPAFWREPRINQKTAP